MLQLFIKLIELFNFVKNCITSHDDHVSKKRNRDAHQGDRNSLGRGRTRNSQSDAQELYVGHQKPTRYRKAPELIFDLLNERRIFGYFFSVSLISSRYQTEVVKTLY